MPDAWIYGDDSRGTDGARLLAELGFTPRRAPARGALRPVADGGGAGGPPAVLLVLADALGEDDDPADLLARLRADPSLADVPTIAAVTLAGLADRGALDADELILLPLDAGELAARIARARARLGIVQDVVRVGALEIDLAAYEAILDGRPLALTHTEYRLLMILATHPDRVLSRATLLAQVWGDRHDDSPRKVDGQIARLRTKLGDEYGARIRTVRSVGYRFQGGE